MARSSPWVLGLALCGVPLVTAAGDVASLASIGVSAPGAQVAARDMELYLDVSINQMPRGVRRFIQRDGRLWAEAKNLQELGIQLPEGGGAELPLDELRGMTVDYDAVNQRLAINASLDQLNLPRTQLGAVGVGAAKAGNTPGILLNYDLYGTAGRGGSASLGAFTELRAFRGNDLITSTALTRTVRTGEQAAWKGESARLDTTWTRSFPDEALSLRVGDTVTAGLPWSRSTRIGGVQLASNYALQPYRSTAPLPSFLGSATLPSQVDLFVNGMRQFSGSVPAGPFEINALPSINAAGNAQVVLTDALGRTSTMDFSLYDSERLLAPGLSDWSVDLGFVRRNYGLSSFDYGKELVASGTWRHGVTHQLTVEAHGEATRGLAVAGGGAIYQTQGWGRVSAGVAHSTHSEGSGSLLNVGYNWRGRKFNAGFDVTGTHGDYRDVASQYGSRPARVSARAQVGYTTDDFGSFSLGYIHRELAREATEASRASLNESTDRSRYASMSWSRALNRRAFVNVSLTQNLDVRRDRGLFVGLSFQLDPTTHSSAGIQSNAGSTSARAQVSQAVPSAGGWGWRTAARLGDSDMRGAQGELNYLGRYGRVDAGLQSYGNQHLGYANASGSLAVLGGNVFAARRIDDGFAVVSTQGVPGVPVTLHNTPVGVTDSRGMLLVSPLQPYQHNPVGIDTLDLPADVRSGQVSVQATPAKGAGTLVSFDLERVRSASFVLLDSHGKPLPQGSTVQRQGAGPDDLAVVGFDGQGYLEGLSDMNTLHVTTPQGNQCVASFELPKASAGIAELGNLICMEP